MIKMIYIYAYIYRHVFGEPRYSIQSFNKMVCFQLDFAMVIKNEQNDEHHLRTKALRPCLGLQVFRVSDLGLWCFRVLGLCGLGALGFRVVGFRV